MEWSEDLRRLCSGKKNRSQGIETDGRLCVSAQSAVCFRQLLKKNKNKTVAVKSQM